MNQYQVEAYNFDVKKLFIKSQKKNFTSQLDSEIKWTRSVKQDLKKGNVYKFSLDASIVANYRPFSKKKMYLQKRLHEMQYFFYQILPNGKGSNVAISVMGNFTGTPYFSFAIDAIPDCNFVSPASGGSQCIPLYRFDENGNYTVIITDWDLAKFFAHYITLAPPITKQAIFHYVSVVLHDPIYREKYALNLKREFPREHFYPDFGLGQVGERH